MMWHKAFLNGPRPVGSHPNLPVTLAKLAREGPSDVEAGAVALHIHPRPFNGLATLEPEAVARTLTA